MIFAARFIKRLMIRSFHVHMEDAKSGPVPLHRTRVGPSGARNCFERKVIKFQAWLGEGSLSTSTAKVVIFAVMRKMIVHTFVKAGS